MAGIKNNYGPIYWFLGAKHHAKLVYFVSSQVILMATAWGYYFTIKALLCVR